MVIFSTGPISICGQGYAFTWVETISNSPDRSSFGFCEFGLYLAHNQDVALKIPGTN